MFYKFNPNILPQIRLINSVKIKPPYIHKKRKADEYILYIIKKGNMYLSENGKKYVISEGDFFLLDPSYVHEGYKASFCEYYYIHFNHIDIEKFEIPTENTITEVIINKRNASLRSNSFSYSIYDKDECIFPKQYHFSNYNTFITISNLLTAAIEQDSNHLENYKILCSCKVVEVLIETYRCFVLTEIINMSAGVPKSYKKVQELLTFLNSEYAEKISSSTIEEMLDCNFDYINRIFRKLTQKTIFTYLNMVRINHAKEFISSTSMKLSEIGGSVGIDDEYYFSKVFKKYTGVSPTIYAKGVLK